jgi:hypothetical protein
MDRILIQSYFFGWRHRPVCEPAVLLFVAISGLIPTAEHAATAEVSDLLFAHLRSLRRDEGFNQTWYATPQKAANPHQHSAEVRSCGAVRRELNPHPLGSEPSAVPFSFARVFDMIPPSCSRV